MKTKRILQSLTLVFVLLMALVLAGMASAAPPVIENGTFEDTKMLDWQPCPGIEVWDHLTGTYRQTSYFDNQGNLTEIKFFFSGIDNIYNPENPGVVLSGNFNVTTQVDLQTGEFINASGIDAHITVPGYGKVLFLTGHWVRYPEIHLGGINSFQNPEDMAVFCSLLAGD